MATVWKVIQPKRLKEGAFRLYMLNALRRAATELKVEYRKTTATWRHKPKWEQAVSLRSGMFRVTVDTRDPVYGYVDLGTRPHMIFPRKQGGVLRWNSRFYPKTFPGVIGSVAGFSGGPPAYAKYVHHPGTEARGFSKNIERIYRPRFYRLCNRAMREFARGSGHYAGRT